VQVFSLAIILQIILKAASYTHHSSQTGMASQIQAFTIFSTSHTVDRQLPRPTGRERRQLREGHGQHAVLELRLCVLEVC
jgi:hypothetical protein